VGDEMWRLSSARRQVDCKGGEKGVRTETQRKTHKKSSG
jgi:hypothetical protein